MNYAQIKNICILVVVMLMVSACGYSPSSKFARNILGEKISTSVVISAHDPENTVIIKDTIDSAIIEVFQASLVDKTKSTTHLDISMGLPSYTPIVYDEHGYVTGFRMVVKLSIIKIHNKKTKTYTASGSYDFTVAPNAIVTDKERFEAIRFSTQRAIRSFISQVSAEGAREIK